MVFSCYSKDVELWDWSTFLIEGIILPILAVFGIAGKDFSRLRFSSLSVDPYAFSPFFLTSN